MGLNGREMKKTPWVGAGDSGNVRVALHEKEKLETLCTSHAGHCNPSPCRVTRGRVESTSNHGLSGRSMRS